MFIEEAGLNDKKYKVISVPSSFHHQYNPVLYCPVGKMSKDFKDDTMPRMVTKIEEIIAKHGDEKGIIHCNSYDIAFYIYNNLKIFKYRTILQDRNDRGRSLKEFLNSKDKILISINMIEGLDLKDDLARYQILAKVPYPFVGDKRVHERLIVRGEDDWFNLQAVEDICQAFGRAVRTDEDWATFYILDESFANLWNRYQAFFTQEFINSYKYGIQLKEASESTICLLPK
jgi:Rad3-related DNA helicase